MIEKKNYDNRIGVWGWISGGCWGPERYLYTLHRITGLGILSYFLLHIFVTSSRVFGQGAWIRAMQNVDAPIFKIGEFLVYLAFAFHALNGIRLILVELGFTVAIGQPEEPVYPYHSSLHVQRPLLIAVMIVAGILALAGGVNFMIRL